MKKTKRKPVICAPCSQGRHGNKGPPEYGKLDHCPDVRCGCPCRKKAAQAANKTKGQTKKLKVKWKLPSTFEISLNWVVMHPPPTELEKCPRCEKRHKKLKPLKLKKPMDFYGPDGKLFARASHWAVCPKTKEPIVLLDRADMGQTIENVVIKQAADDIAKEIDKEILGDLAKMTKEPPAKEKKGRWVKKKVVKTQEVWVDDPEPKSRIEVKATLGPGQAWVYDPNAPHRMVPGTKAEAKAQRARVRAQEKAAKPLREKGRKR